MIVKPNISGTTIPIPINSNYIVGGLRNITNYYIDSLGGRKSLIMSKLEMGNSGHFARTVMLLVSSINLSKTVESCNTVHPIKIELTTKDHLIRMRGRYYRTMYSRNYQLLKGDEYNLIGETIFVKSPVTCACKDGICKMCYGELSYINNDISIGVYAGTKITEPVSQNILSSKHLLTTKSEKIQFNEEFYRFFNISGNEIIINPNDDLDNLDDYSLLIIKSNIKTIADYDDNDMEFNEYVNLFHVYNKKTNEMIEIKESRDKDLYISPELRKLFKKKSKKEVYEIDFKNIDDDRIFVIEVVNNELTRPLYDIMRLIDRVDYRIIHWNCVTIDQMCQKMLDLIIESEINSDSVHGELILTPLLRDKDDILERPKFNKYFNGDEGYQILTVKSALEKHPSVLVGLSFQALDRQLTNPLTFRKKESSFIDPFFKERP